MSRLDVYRQKQYKKRVTFFVVALIVLVIFLFTVGYNFLIKSSLFLGGLGQTTQQSDDTDAFFGTLEVDTPPTATNSAKLLVSGSVSGYDAVTISINDRDVKDLHNKTSFSETIGDLKKGQNEIKFIAKASKHKAEIKTETYSVLYKSDKPKLEVTEPADQAHTHNTDIKVAGKTDPDVTIRINDLPIVVDVQGNFQTSVRLQDGDNKIKVVAIDIAGNTETKELTVRYEKD